MSTSAWILGLVQLIFIINFFVSLKKGKKAEDIGIEAAERLKNEMSYGAPVDEYLADNLVPLVALFGGRFRASKITNHLLTNVYVVEQFLGKGLVTVDSGSRIIESKGWNPTGEVMEP